MADEEINDQVSKGAPSDETDELWGQETGGGSCFKVTSGDIMSSLLHARGISNSVFGGVKSGSVNVVDCSRISTGVYDWTLSNPVTDVDTAQMFVQAMVSSGGIEVGILMTSTTVARVTLSNGGVLGNYQHAIFLFDEA